MTQTPAAQQATGLNQASIQQAFGATAVSWTDAVAAHGPRPHALAAGA